MESSSSCTLCFSLQKEVLDFENRWLLSCDVVESLEYELRKVKKQKETLLRILTRVAPKELEQLKETT